MPASAHRSYLHHLLAGLAALLVLNAAWAVVVDPFKVFGLADLNKRNFEPNTRYLKIEYLKGHDVPGLIFGSSRANGYGTATAARLAGFRFYNMNADSETPYGVYRKLRWILARERPRMVLWALDYDRFQQPPGRDPNDLAGQEHPEVSGTPKPLFFWKFLWVYPLHYAYDLYGNFIKAETWYRFDPTTGHYHFPLFDRQMKSDPRGYIKARFRYPGGRPVGRPNPAQLDYLRRVVDLLRAEDIPLHILVNPVNHRIFRDFDGRDYGAWLAEVARIAGRAWDFSGYNSVTTDDTLYYEESHFTFPVGDMALNFVFGAARAAGGRHADFGVVVTPANVAERRRDLLAQQRPAPPPDASLAQRNRRSAP